MRRSLQCMVVALAAAVVLPSPRTVGAQAAVVIPLSDRPIPKGTFKSWSLFVICSVDWLLPQNDAQIGRLYDQFEAYGNAIGPDHAAVWFWTERTHKKTSIDTARNSQLCASLQLLPSKSPYLILTTRYPGEALSKEYPRTFPTNTDLGDHLVLSLNGISAADTTQMLSSLADKLVAGKLSDVTVGSAEYWSAWQAAYNAVRDEIGGLLGRVTVSFDTGVVKTEIKFAKQP